MSLIKAKNKSTQVSNQTIGATGQSLADRQSNAISGITLTDAAAFNLTLSDQGTVQRSFELADKAFGSIERGYKDSTAQVAAATQQVAKAYEKGRELEGAVNADNLFRWLIGAAVILGGGFIYVKVSR